uniref:DUF5320 domain-containing protein n=1 Tax=Thermogladius calderae TaxID=1200300 RepID=A0A7J3Y0Q3_9CREN
MSWWKHHYCGPWPGHGPWSYLPPWERPGWILWWGAGIQPPVAPLTKEAELQYLENLRSYLQNLLKQVEDRINELKGSK